MLNPADAAFVAVLARQLPDDTLREAEPRHRQEPRGRWTGQPGPLALPRRTEEVATILRACASARVGVVPLGGGTGLVGGQVLHEGPAPVILSLERMAAIRAVHPQENVLIAEAGATLAAVQDAARAAGRKFPLSIASEGSARIGGVLSTNAGGINVLHDGSARDLCLGIEAVLADGSVLQGLKRLRKDNTGYDLRHLLIGAEGTLGVITAASLKLVAEPQAVGTAFFAVPGPAQALALLSLLQEATAGGVLAYELIHRQGMEFLDETGPEVRQPFAMRPEWMVLIEIALPAGSDAAETLATTFARAEAGGLATDGIVAQSLADRAAFWHLRESLPEANKRIGAVSSHDIALPLGVVAEFLDRAGPALARLGPVRVNCFGHLGDGNLHYNVFAPKGARREDFAHLATPARDLVHGLAVELGGTFSAEHGIGRLKAGELERYGDPAKLAAMRAIKAALDPAGIMNPGVVLRAG